MLEIDRITIHTRQAFNLEPSIAVTGNFIDKGNVEKAAVLSFVPPENAHHA